MDFESFQVELFVSEKQQLIPTLYFFINLFKLFDINRQQIQ